MSDIALIVDDDVRLLEGLRRNLRGRVNVLTATDGSAALEILRDQGPIAVILCDMRMPGMDGIAVLRAARERFPETVRMMLTGNADQATAVDAINRGEIFRFLNKPCESDRLVAALEAGIRQYRLATGERELLEQTLAGSLRLLLDVLKLSGAGMADAIPNLRRWGRAIAQALQLPDPWKLDVALMLSEIGAVAIPPSIAASLATANRSPRRNASLSSGHLSSRAT